MQIRRHLLASIVLLLLAVLPARSEPLRLILPTSNDALLRGDGPAFYQYTDRYFNGVRSRPWQGGKYGFVRNPKETPEGLIYTRFHEGVDIKPRYRDHRGEPLDTVRAIADGYIVYVNAEEHRSSYGKYVVVEHWWSGSPFYSLYAHLGDVNVRKGERVLQAERLGRIGYTGRGLDRRRAHLHFEINMLLNEGFHHWYDVNFRSTNRHGIHNGINMAGLDVAALYEALEVYPDLKIEDFIKSQSVAFTIAVPNRGIIDLITRYEWLGMDAWNEDAASWEISFTYSGLPVWVGASSRSVSSAAVIDIARSTISYSDLTEGLVAGNREKYYLTNRGKRYASLVSHVGPERVIVRRDTPSFQEVGHSEEPESEQIRSW